MICWRSPCSEYCSAFLPRRTFNRVWSIQKSFSNGCVSVSAPTWPEEFWNGKELVIPDLSPFVLETLPPKSYIVPHGRVPVKLELKLSSLYAEPVMTWPF